jgi:endonuclease/exonuclease/phosphatase family metal-dependent hydrolase
VIADPTGPFGKLDPRDSLAVFSWNMAVGGGDLLSFLEEEVGAQCSGSETRPGRVYPHFVVLLQEAFRRSEDLPPLDDPSLAARKSLHDSPPRGDPDVLEVAARCGLAAVYVPSGRNGADAPGERLLDKGNAILSTLPLSDFIAVENPFETERKVGVAASVPTPDPTPLRLVSFHTEVTSTFRRALLTGNQTRTRQVLGLIEVLGAHERNEGRSPPTLLGGDFNTWSGGESALKMLRLAFPDSPAWDGESTRGPFPTDHIFFREGSGEPGDDGTSTVLVHGSYKALEESFFSDHRGRFVRLRFRPGPGGG